MTQRRQVYRCYVCGNVVEVLTSGGGELICCGVRMVLLQEKVQEAGQENHAPVVERLPGGVRVRVGRVGHAMGGDHFVEWLEVYGGDRLCRRYLGPQDSPEAEFPVTGQDVQARAYCNRHGLWRS